MGGGILCMSLLLALFNFDIHQAAAINTALISSGVLMAVIIALNMKHPYYPRIDKPLISFDCIIVLLPGLQLGSKIGSFINIVFP